MAKKVPAGGGRGTCFVVMGFGKKTDFETGRTLDLDKSYLNLIKPAIEKAGLACVRADEIVHSGLIDVPMYEQLLKADVVVADLSTSNKNAFYELGVRHALRPYTTVVIAEDGIKTFPFDVNHVVVRQYHHLGEDIGYSEVKRFRKALTGAVRTILQKDPPDPDSPVYTFLKNLSPPQFAAAMKATAKDLKKVLGGLALASGPGPGSGPGPNSAATETHSVLMRQVDEAKKRGDFTTAKSLLAAARALKAEQTPGGPEDPYLVQQLALMTYKSKQPTERAALEEARGILKVLGPETSNDTETLGLWGAVHKRLWDLCRDKPKGAEYLDESVRAYERGFYLRNDYYNGINFAYLLNVRAAHAKDPADAVADFVHARRVRREVLDVCDRWLKDNPAPAPKVGEKAVNDYRKNAYWVLATKAEALLGLGDPAWEPRLKAAYAAAPEGWMKSSTEEQVAKLKPLLDDSPLARYLNPAASAAAGERPSPRRKSGPSRRRTPPA
jgi:hypothetical protein